jgi:hypothetical protein
MLLFLHPVHRAVRFGVLTVSGKIGGNSINSPTQVHPNLINPCLKPVDLVTQHLMPFNNDIQLMLKILGHDANMLFEVLRYIIDMPPEKFIDLSYIFSIHDISTVAKDE